MLQPALHCTALQGSRSRELHAPVNCDSVSDDHAGFAGPRGLGYFEEAQCWRKAHLALNEQGRDASGKVGRAFSPSLVRLTPLFSPPPPLPLTTASDRDLPAAMAFSARRSLATSLSHHFSRRFHPSISHLIPPHHDNSDPAPSPSSSPVPSPRPQSQQPAPPFPSALPWASRSRAVAPFPLPFALHLAAHRHFSASPPDTDVLTDAAAAAAPVSELLSDGVASAAASVPLPPAPYPGEVAAAAAESFPPVAALQHLLDAVQSFTGLNWYVPSGLCEVSVSVSVSFPV